MAIEFKVSFLLGALLYVVCWVATPLSSAKSMSPWPFQVYEDVSRSSFLGKRKTTEQVLPAYESGMSKLKMVLQSELMLAL